MTLHDELLAVKQQVATQLPPDVLAAMDGATAELSNSDLAHKALQPGQRMPDFLLPDATGRRVASMALRARGPLLTPSTAASGAPTATSRCAHYSASCRHSPAAA